MGLAWWEDWEELLSAGVPDVDEATAKWLLPLPLVGVAISIRSEGNGFLLVLL